MKKYESAPRAAGHRPRIAATAVSGAGRPQRTHTSSSLPRPQKTDARTHAAAACGNGALNARADLRGLTLDPASARAMSAMR